MDKEACPVITRETLLSLLNTEQRRQLKSYLDMLVMYNKRLNLVSRQLSPEQIQCIALDSLVPMYFKLVPDACSILDIGAGAGLSAIPAAILCPHSAFTLAESSFKKSTLLLKMVESLGLKNIKILNKRLSTYEIFCGKYFEIVTLKAVSYLKSYCCLFSALLKSGGKVVYFKGQRSACSERAEGFNFTNHPYIFQCGGQNKNLALWVFEKR